jgi:hypothetical protein
MVVPGPFKGNGQKAVEGYWQASRLSKGGWLYPKRKQIGFVRGSDLPRKDRYVLLDDDLI